MTDADRDDDRATAHGPLSAGLFSRSLSRRNLLASLGVAGIGLSLGGCSNSAESGDSLQFLTWRTYTGQTTLPDFRRQAGIAVRASYFATSAELLTRLQEDEPGYDVILPANELVARLRVSNMLQPLDMAKIPNFANISSEFQEGDHAPPPRHAIPYAWMVMGIGYRRSRVHGVPDSWRWLYESDLYKGRIALSAEPADLIRLGAKYLGHSLNRVAPDVTRQVEEMLIRQSVNIRAFHHDDGDDMLRAGSVDLVMATNGDIARIARDDADIGFVVPREGSLLNADMLCIPARAPNPDAAHQFINYLLDAEVGRDIAAEIFYPTPNAAAKALMPADWRDNPIIFPHGPGMEASEWGHYEGPEQGQAFEAAIAQVRARVQTG